MQLKPLIQPSDLLSILPYVKVVDASWAFPGERNCYEQYLKERITGAVFFDIDVVADKSTSLPHMLPDEDSFAQAVAALGISDTDDLVIYDTDTSGMFSAPRAWWTFKTMGHKGSVAVLDGGLSGWKNMGMPLDSGVPTTPEPGHYEAKLQPLNVWSLQQVLANLKDKTVQIVDARSPSRFAEGPEPRAGLKVGHIPGSRNLHYSTLISGGRLKPAPAIKQLFEQAGVDLNRPIVTSCGSGITAAMLSFALHVAGSESAVYDGSSAEYLMETLDNPVELGPPQ